MNEFIILDVGCRDQPYPRWFRLPNLRVIGWDVDKAECDRLQSIYPQFLYLPCGLGAKSGCAPFYQTAGIDCSSFLRPCHDAHLIDQLFQEVGKVEGVEIRTLDSFREYFPQGADLLKIDTQGTELEVLKGAEETLKSVLMVEVETEFNPFYEGQALFGDVDAFLRSRGFQFWDFQDMNRYSAKLGHTFDRFSDTSVGGVSGLLTDIKSEGQLNWAESFYVTNPIRNLEKTKILAHALDFENFGE